jgi:hypothetical protein
MSLDHSVPKGNRTDRNTAASDCMAFCMSRRICDVGLGPEAFLSKGKKKPIQYNASPWSSTASDKKNLRHGNSPDLIQELNALHTSLFGDRFVGLACGRILRNVMRAGTTKDDDVKKRVGSKSVCSVD